MNTVTYSGHTASDAGVSTWPSRRVTRRWEHVTKIETGLSFDAKTYHAKILFTVGKTLTLRGTKFAPSSMRRFAAFLACAIARAPATAEIDERTREIAQWGGAEMEARVKRMKGMAPSMAQWLEQARFLRARLEHGKALKAVARVLERQPSHVEALELRFQLLEETGARLPKLIAAAEQVLLHAPDDVAARTRVLGLKLQANDARVVPEVEQVLAREPDNFVVGFALAGYFFRTKDFDRAMAVTDALARRPGATAWQRGAAESRDYVQRYATSGTFRAKERLKYWGRIAAVFVPLVLLVAGKWWSVQARQAREDRARREGLVAAETYAKQLQAAKNRAAELEKASGWAMGSFAEIKQRADAGEAMAQFTVAESLFEGERGASKDHAEALRYLELAEAQGYPLAVTSLAERYKEGRGVPRDEVRALAMLRRAVELGSPRAAGLLGHRYLEGDGVEQDPAKAFSLFKQSAAGGMAWGYTSMGWALESGAGVSRDLKAALDCYRRAAEKNDLWAQERLVQLLSESGAVDHDHAEARTWAFAGARQGSEWLRGRLFAELLAGERASPQETIEVQGWMRDDAAKGSALALFHLGNAEWQGWHRMRDWTAAAKLYGRAAEKNHPESMLLYARCLAAGVGVPKDLVAARRWREKLALVETLSPEVSRLDQLIVAMEQPLPELPAVGESRPRAIWQEGPKYPWKMAEAEIAGEVVVEFVIGKDGHTEQVQVVRSSHQEFEQPALTAVAFWRFVPGARDGQPVNLRVSQLLEFDFQDQKATGASANRRLPPAEK